MKKVLLAMLVAALVCPSFAVVNFTAVDNTDGTVTIQINTGGDTVRGVALKIVGDGSTKLVSLTPVYVNPAFNTFIDYFAQNGLVEVVGATPAQEGHPFADTTAAGVAAVNAVEFSISMGALDALGGQAGFISNSAVDLITFEVGAGLIDIHADTLRGPASGVVGNPDVTLTSNLPLTNVQVTSGVQEAISSAAPFYNDWVTFGSPSCWAYKYNCRGDVNGQSEGNVLQGYAYVFNADLNVFLAAYGVREAPKGPGIASIPNGICADFARNAEGNVLQGYARVFNSDLNILLASYGVREAPKGPGLVPCPLVADGGWINFYTQP